jgi:hypothetical protein
MNFELIKIISRVLKSMEVGDGLLFVIVWVGKKPFSFGGGGILEGNKLRRKIGNINSYMGFHKMKLARLPVGYPYAVYA